MLIVSHCPHTHLHTYSALHIDFCKVEKGMFGELSEVSGHCL